MKCFPEFGGVVALYVFGHCSAGAPFVDLGCEASSVNCKLWQGCCAPQEEVNKAGWVLIFIVTSSGHGTGGHWQEDGPAVTSSSTASLHSFLISGFHPITSSFLAFTSSF